MPSYQPVVSIIINTHNSIEYLKEALDSAYQQTYPHVEIMVYDNASTCDVQAITKGYERVKYHRSDKFLTLGAARNEALKMAQGELIDFLDSDDVFLPQKLEKQVPLFANPQVGLVFSNSYTLEKDTTGQWKPTLKFNRPLPSGNLFGPLLEGYFLCFDTVIFRKSAIGDNPQYWFPEHFNICTDYDLFLKISHSFQLCYVDEALSMWRVHGQNWSIKKAYLDPLERLMMIPRMLEYEPKLFQKYRQEIHTYLSRIRMGEMDYYWKLNLKREAVSCAIHVFLVQPSLSHLLKIFFVLFCSFSQYQKISLSVRQHFP